MKAKVYNNNAKYNILAGEASLRGLLEGREQIYGMFIVERLKILIEAAKVSFVT